MPIVGWVSKQKSWSDYSGTFVMNPKNMYLYKLNEAMAL